MTIRISLKAVAFAVYTMALLAGAFGISYAVFEWRDDDVNSPAVFKCQEEAWDDWMETQKDAPDPPPSGSSDTARNQYNQDFAAAKAHNELAYDEYMDRVKDCFP